MHRFRSRAGKTKLMRFLRFAFLSRYRDFGLLLIRLGLGVMYIYHGLPKLAGGPELWAKLGRATAYLGMEFAPGFWGFMAAFSEVFGGVFLILGFLFRPACLLLLATMTVAAAMHLGKGEGLQAASHAIENGIVFLALLFVGPGRLSLDGEG